MDNTKCIMLLLHDSYAVDIFCIHVNNLCITTLLYVFQCRMHIFQCLFVDDFLIIFSHSVKNIIFVEIGLVENALPPLA